MKSVSAKITEKDFRLLAEIKANDDEVTVSQVIRKGIREYHKKIFSKISHVI